LKASRITAVLIILLAAVVAVGGCGRPTAPAGGKMVVAASITPLADFCRQVGGKYVDVRLLIPANASPHTYQIAPDQMDAISQARVLVLNGVSLEYWADKTIDAAGNPRLITIRTAKGLPILGSTDAHEPGGNPHVWLNPVYAVHQVIAIRDAFAKADPAHKAAYFANSRAYIARLNKLDRDIRREVSTFRSKQFVAFHPAWVYFAREYGLTQAAVIEQSPGREPSPAELNRVIRAVRAIHAKAIFAEPQFSTKAADVIAEEAGAKVLLLDPLGRPPATSYISMMRRNLAQMARALK